MPLNTGRGLRTDAAVWVTGALQTNPIDQTILADSGPIVMKGDYLIAVQGGGSAGYNYDMQLRDASNSTTVALIPRFASAGEEDLIVAWLVTMDVGQRVRAVLQGGITGTVRLAIGLQPVI